MFKSSSPVSGMGLATQVKSCLLKPRWRFVHWSDPFRPCHQSIGDAVLSAQSQVEKRIGVVRRFLR